MDYDGNVTADESPFKNQKGIHAIKQFHLDFCISKKDGMKSFIIQMYF